MYDKYITIEELNEIKKDIITNNLNYKSFFRYYKLSIILNDKNIMELLSKSYPTDINYENEEKFYEIKAILKYKLKYKI